jgi:hypothetical protein
VKYCLVLRCTKYMILRDTCYPAVPLLPPHTRPPPRSCSSAVTAPAPAPAPAAYTRTRHPRSCSALCLPAPAHPAALGCARLHALHLHPRPHQHRYPCGARPLVSTNFAFFCLLPPVPRTLDGSHIGCDVNVDRGKQRTFRLDAFIHLIPPPRPLR